MPTLCSFGLCPGITTKAECSKLTNKNDVSCCRWEPACNGCADNVMPTPPGHPAGENVACQTLKVKLKEKGIDDFVGGKTAIPQCMYEPAMRHKITDQDGKPCFPASKSPKVGTIIGIALLVFFVLGCICYCVLTQKPAAASKAGGSAGVKPARGSVTEQQSDLAWEQLKKLEQTARLHAAAPPGKPPAAGAPAPASSLK